MSLLIEHAAETRGHTVKNTSTVAPLELANSLELCKTRGHITLTDEEYARLAETSAEEVRQLCSNLSQWNLHSTNNGIEIFERKSTLKNEAENMLLLVVTLPCSMQKLEKLLTPWDVYRHEWDAMLEKAELINSWPEKEIFLVRHLVRKMFPMSARESIDIVKITRQPDEVIFGCCSTTHAKFPPNKAYVRTHQYLGGYVFRPCDSNPDHTKFHMLFHADLNLPGPKLVSNLASKFKPKFMIQKVDNLKLGIQKFDI